MANAFNCDVAMKNRSGGTGHRELPATKRSGGALRMHVASWPKVPGKTGPKRNTTGAKVCRTHPTSKGL